MEENHSLANIIPRFRDGICDGRDDGCICHVVLPFAHTTTVLITLSG